jgi:hypothetical protein
VDKHVKLTYDPSNNELVQLMMPFMTSSEVGVSDKQLIYKFDFNGGALHLPVDWQIRLWGATRPAYREQMMQLKLWLDEAKAKGRKKCPSPFMLRRSVAQAWGSIPEEQNPHRTIAAYARDLDIVVFNGDVHTTEAYHVDGVKYFVLGGGGAEQNPILPGRTHNQFPMVIRWTSIGRAKLPKRITTICVEVKPGQPTKFSTNRFRPWSAEPFATVELLVIRSKGSHPNSRFVVPAQTVDATPSNAFIQQCFQDCICLAVLAQT